jgi:hypothetical protein
MARYCIMARDRSVTPPRFVFLRLPKPTFVPAGETAPDGTTSEEPRLVELRWTWVTGANPDGSPVWRNGQEPIDLGRRKAELVAGMIDGAKAVRMGDDDAPAPTQADVEAAERAERLRAREAYAAALAAGDEAAL